jgi:hypothetical protein
VALGPRPNRATINNALTNLWADDGRHARLSRMFFYTWPGHFAYWFDGARPRLKTPQPSYPLRALSYNGASISIIANS